MKPFLCTDITTNKKNKTKDGQEFSCGCPNEAYSSAYEKICNQLDKMQKDNEKKLLVWMGISFFFTIVWFAIFYYLMEATDWWFDNMFQTKPVLSIILIASFVLAYGMDIVALKRSGKYKKSKEYLGLIARKDNILNAMYEDMRVANDAVQVDIITFNYKVKNGKKIPKGNMNETVPYRFSPFVLWGDEQFLYLADCKQKYAFAKKYLSKISYKNQSVSMLCNDKYFDRKKAKDRELAQNNRYYLTKPHFTLEYDDGIEKVEIYYTNFNSKAFEKISGLEAKENIEHLKSWRK